jgi:MFS family permease
VPRPVAFWLLASVLTATMLGTTLPTPLYVIYQAQWHFSSAIVTVTFAVYAAAVLATFLLAGRASDLAGRKPVLAVALGASALSTVVFILAPNVLHRPDHPRGRRRGGLRIRRGLPGRTGLLYPARHFVRVLADQHPEDRIIPAVGRPASLSGCLFWPH